MYLDHKQQITHEYTHYLIHSSHIHINYQLYAFGKLIWFPFLNDSILNKIAIATQGTSCPKLRVKVWTSTVPHNCIFAHQLFEVTFVSSQ